MKKFILAVVAAAFCTLAIMQTSPVRADLMVMPPRIAFKDGDRIKTLTIANTSVNSAVYRLSFLHQKQLEEGGYQMMDAAPDPATDLSKMLVFSPRQVQLEPGGKQGVRLSLRRPENLPDGEYKVHIKVERYVQQEERKVAKGAKVGVGVNVGFAVPVILRKGKYDTAIKISDIKYLPAGLNLNKTPAPPRLSFYLNRTGKYSALGRVLLMWAPKAGAEEVQVGLLNKFNVFTDVPRRLAEVNIEPPQGTNVSGGLFRIRFEGDDIDKGIVFDETTFPAP